VTLPAPTHINQLRAGGTFPNGQPSGPFDCTPASAIMALDAYSHGALRPSVSDFRRRQTDNDTNGMGLDDAATAWRSYGQTLVHGPMTWGQVMARLKDGNGVVLQGQSGALGPYAIGRSVPHALYVQRAYAGATTTILVVNDPLASAARSIPASYVRAFYLSGLALAGYGKGVYAGAAVGVGSGATAPPAVAGLTPGLMDEWLRRIGRAASDPIRDGDVIPFVRFLQEKRLVQGGTGSNPLVRAVELSIRAHVGQPWATLGAAINAQIAPGVDPFGIGAAVAGIPAALGVVFGKLALLGGIVVLGLLGVYLAAKGEAPAAAIKRAAA
jgi:hypothetical protein